MNPVKRRARLIELLKRLDDGLDIPVRDIKIVLTEDEYAEFLEMWQHQKEIRTAPKPASVKHYEKLLNLWHVAEARNERYSGRHNKKIKISTKLSHETDHCLEAIQEHYEEQQKNSEFLNWVREPYKHFEPALVVTSRNHLNIFKRRPYQLSKRVVKKQVLKNALDELENPTSTNENNDISLVLQPKFSFEDAQKKEREKNKDRFKDFKF